MSNALVSKYSDYEPIEQQLKSNGLGIESHMEWYVIIVVSQDIHIGNVGSCSIEIEDFSLLMLRLQLIPQSSQLCFQRMNMPSC